MTYFGYFSLGGMVNQSKAGLKPIVVRATLPRFDPREAKIVQQSMTSVLIKIGKYILDVYGNSPYYQFVITAPASGIKLIYTKPDSRTINLTCSATGIYPKPEVQLLWGSE